MLEAVMERSRPLGFLREPGAGVTR